MEKINWPLSVAASVVFHAAIIVLVLFFSGDLGGGDEAGPTPAERAEAGGAPALDTPAPSSGAAREASAGNTRPVVTPVVTVPAATTPPAAGADDAAFAVYTVKPGDSLSRIARNHGCTVREIAELNGFPVTKTLNIGESVKVPR